VNVAILISRFIESSGIAQTAFYQSKALSKKGMNVKIFTLVSNIRPPRNVCVEILGLPEGLLSDIMYRLSFPLNLNMVIKALRKLKNFDCIIAHDYPMTYIAQLAKLLFGSSFFYYNHGTLSYVAFERLEHRLYMTLFTMFQIGSSFLSDLVISVSDYAKEQYRKLSKRDSITIYNFVDLNLFNIQNNGSIIRKKYGLIENPLVLFVGYIVPNKGVHLLAKAFRYVVREIPKAKLLIIGRSGPQQYVNEIRKLLKESVLFIGEIPHRELPYYYSACDIYASASLYETFNLPIVEAQACGKPIVAFDIPAHREVVEHGKTGYLIELRDTKSFASSIIELLKNSSLRNHMSINAYEWIRRKFSYETTLGKFVKVISRFCSKR